MADCQIVTPQAAAGIPPVDVADLRTVIGEEIIHDGLDLTMRRGEILGLVGASGAGKSVLLRTMIGLLPPAAGTVRIFGRDLYKVEEEELTDIKRRWGVLFQANALFSTLSVIENVAVPLRESGARLDEELILHIAAIKTRMAGLPPAALHLMPAELSGGMLKRAGVARAIATDPELLLLDEPTAGLDPIMADQIDALIKSLTELLHLSVLLVTHDLDTLYGICDRVAVLADKRIIAVAPVHELERSDHPWIREFFLGPRSRTSGTR